MEIDNPEVLAEVTALHDRYEIALGENDTETLQALFWNNPLTIRYGIGENLYSWEEIGAFRGARSPIGLARTTSRTRITAFGRDCATASTLFSRESLPGKIGRQMQTWVRMPEGWRIVAAHVSVISEQ